MWDRLPDGKTNPFGRRIKNLRFHVNLDEGVSWAMEKIIEPSADQSCPLKYESRYVKVVSDCPITVFLHKCHQESKTDEYHHMDVLENWKRKSKKDFLNIWRRTIQKFQKWLKSPEWQKTHQKCNKIQINCKKIQQISVKSNIFSNWPLLSMSSSFSIFELKDFLF